MFAWRRAQMSDYETHKKAPPMLAVGAVEEGFDAADADAVLLVLVYSTAYVDLVAVVDVDVVDVVMVVGVVDVVVSIAVAVVVGVLS
mmetsp:Transcript_4194/g.6121  ORF Transcript_4194/g.6121 Transcript_4194/m.6121 type:complete len:87 (+) Transcript_4194:1236-1496(+)